MPLDGEEGVLMKKTILQMTATVLVLWGIFTVHADHMPMLETVMAEAPPTESIALPILMYHSLLKDNARAGPYVLSPHVLQTDLQYLQKQGYETVTVTDLIAYVQQGKPLPEKPVMITFDDGYYNNYLYAYPILQELQMRAVISVIGSQTELFTETGQENAYWSYLRIERLQEMQATGIFEIANHSYNLHTYGARRGCLRAQGEDRAQYAALLQADTQHVQDLLQEAAIPTPQCYTYPFGSLSAESEELLREMGFVCTLGCQNGINYITRDAECLFQMKRFNRPSGIATQAFMHKIGV